MKKIILFLILGLLSCNKKNNHEIKENKADTISQFKSSNFNFNDKTLQGDLNKAILDGDTIAYRRCYKKYVINGRDKEFLYYAILMAEKNNYKGAYYDISRILAIPIEDPLYKKYNFSSKFGKYSMFKAYEMKAHGIEQDIKTFYLEKHKPVPKSSSVYCKD